MANTGSLKLTIFNFIGTVLNKCTWKISNTVDIHQANIAQSYSVQGKAKIKMVNGKHVCMKMEQMTELKVVYQIQETWK